MEKHTYANKIKIGITFVGLAILIYLIYLIPANLFLNSDWGHKLVNRHPERRLMSWESGHSYFPGSVSLNKFSMKVITRRNNWELHLAGVEGRIALFPLMKRTFSVSGLRGRGLEYEYIRLEKPPEQSAGNKSKKRKSWTLLFDQFQVQNVKRLSFQGNVMKGTGTLEGTLHMITRGPLRVFPATLIMKDALLIRNDDTLADHLNFTMKFQSDRYSPSANRGRKALKFFTADLEFQGELSEQVVPESMLTKFPWLFVQDQGSFHGEIRFDHGIFQKGSRVGLTGTQLLASYKDLSVNGSGQVDLVLNEASTQWDHLQSARMEARFLDYEILKKTLPGPLITGKKFLITVESDSFSLDKPMEYTDIRLELNDASIPKIQHLNSFLHTKKFFSFERGKAKATGQFQYLGRQAEGGGWLAFSSERVKISLKEQPYTGGFEFKTHFSRFRKDSRRLVFTGSSIALNNPRNKWSTNLILSEGYLEWPRSRKGKSKKRVLKNAHGEFSVQGGISDIAFINPLIQGQSDFQLHGKAEIHSRIKLNRGDLDGGTTFRFDVPHIEASFLGYQARGKADLYGGIQNIKNRPGRRKAHLDLEIHNYHVARRNLEQDHSQGRLLTASIRMPEFSLSDKNQDIEMQINLPENTIADMRVYNDFWAENSSFQIIEGVGISHGNLHFSSKNDQLSGTYELTAPDLKANFESLPILADLEFKGKLKSRNLKDMVFDLQGSRLTLEHVQTGAIDTEEDWNLKANFQDAQVSWRKPMLAKGRLDLEMTDTGPLISVFAEKKKLLKYAKKILTIQDIEGYADFDLNEDYFDLRHLEIEGDELMIQGRSRMNKSYKRGVLLIEYKGFPFALSLDGDKKRIHPFKPWKKYDNFPVFDD